MKKKPIQVLLLEDNPGDARLFREFLHEGDLAQVELKHVERLKTGLEHLAQGKPDVILLDLGLPDSQGLETFTQVYAQAPDVPIVVLTGLIDAEQGVKAVRAGAQDYLVKGEVSGGLLVRSIRYAIERKRAEEEIRRMALMLDTAPNSITVHDFDGHFVYANQRTFDLHGFTRDEFLALNLHQLDVPDSENLIAPRIQELFECGEATFESAHYRKDGSSLPLEVSARVTTWGDKKVILSIATDITERKRAEKALRESEEWFRTLFEKAGDGIFILYSNGEIVAVNNSFARMHGYSVEEMQKMKLKNLDTQETAQHAPARMRRILAGEILTFEVEHYHKDGHTFPLEVTGSTITVGSEKYVLAFHSDITERKRAEADLLKLHKAVETSGEVIFMTDREGVITFVNPEFTRLYGYSAEEVLGKTTPRILKGGSVKPEEYELFWQTILNKQMVKGELVDKTKDGRLLTIESSVNPILDERNEIMGFLAIQHDITERKQAEGALRLRESYLTAIFENQPGLLWLKDVDSRFLTVNQAFADSCEKTSPAELLGKTDFDIWPKELAEKYRADDASVIRNKASSNVEELIIDRGKAKWFETFKTPVFDGQGPVIGTTGYSRDITNRKQAEERIKRQLGQLSALNEIDRMIASSFDLHLSLTSIVDRVIPQLKVDAADILVMNPDLNILEFGAGHGFHTLGIEKGHLSLGQGYAGRAALERQTIHVPDLRTQVDNPLLRKTLASDNFVSYYAIPLIAKGKVKGVLEIFHRSPLDPDFEWLEFLNMLAGQAALAIDNATMFGNLQRSNSELTLAYDATIEGWSYALDLRDKETEGHTQRVTEMTVKLARTFGLSEAELVQVRWGALLHDIGKMGVPDGILKKPGPLTDEEWVAMKKHPTFAYEMLSPIRYLRLALDIPYCHHEKWDGTGYPRGIKGEQIPLTARLFAVVDVWDALTSDRPYRPAWPKEKVREHIRSLTGTHFDPQVVKTFLLEHG